MLMDAEPQHRHQQAPRGAHMEGGRVSGPAPIRAALQESAHDEAGSTRARRDEAAPDEVGLDEALLARLDRIVELGSRRRRESLNAELLQELRALVREAERLRPSSDCSEKSRGWSSAQHGACTGHNRAVISHWDDVEYVRRDRGHIGGDWASLTGESSVTAGVKRIRVDAGKWSTPAHIEGSEEEIFFVLGGSGISWQDGACYAVEARDFLLHRAGRQAHTLLAGDDGLDVLAFGQRHAVSSAYLPRAGASWLGPSWTTSGSPENHPWAREAAVGPPEVRELLPRPSSIVHVAAEESRDVGAALGSIQTGVKHVRLGPGEEGAPPHVHSAEEEIFVVVAGDGELELTPAPSVRPDALTGTFPVRVGTTVARPAGTRVAHGFRAGRQGMTLLAYGTREPNDIVYYPRSNKVFFRGIGLIGRLEPLDYWDGEA